MPVLPRDFRTTAEVPSAKTQARARSSDGTAGEGAQLGDGTASGGCDGVVGHFATGDSGSDLLAATNNADPG